MFAGAGLAIRGRAGLLRWSLVREPMAYALPLVPTAVLFGLPRVLDRVFLERFAPLASLGFYSLGNSIGNVTAHAQQALKNAWIPMAMKLGLERPDGIAVVGRLGRYYATALTGVALAVALLSREAILLVSPERYAKVADYVPMFAAVATLGALDVLAGIGFALKNMTGRFLGVAVLQAVVGGAAIGIGAWTWGPAGALGGVFLARAFGAGLSFAVSMRLCPVPYGLGRLGVVVLLGVAAFAAGLLTQSMPLGAAVVIKVAILGAWGVAAAAAVIEGGFGTLKAELALIRSR